MWTPFQLVPLISSLPIDSASESDPSTSPPSTSITTATHLFQRSFGSLSRSQKPSLDGRKQTRPVVECVEAWDVHLYIGTSDGVVLHYMLDSPICVDGQGMPRVNYLQKRVIVSGRRVERIVAMKQEEKLVVFCGKLLLLLLSSFFFLLLSFFFFFLSSSSSSCSLFLFFILLVLSCSSSFFFLFFLVLYS